MKKLIIVFGILILWAVIFAVVYERGKQRPGLLYAEIPKETVEFINNLSNHLSDILSSFNPKPDPKDWDNGSNFGEDTQSGLLKYEDEYFIIYYDPSNRKEAQIMKEHAHNAIRPLAGLFGKYFYPADVNGRKLPVYLGKTKSEFGRLVKMLTPHADDEITTRAAGVYISETSSMGCLTKGIVINNELTFTSDRFAKTVIWHEMAHYVFFTSLNYGKNMNVQMWCYEGIAEYFARQGERLTFTKKQIEDMQKECDFSARHFKYVYQNYQGGESIFRFTEKQYSKQAVTGFLSTLYQEGVTLSLKSNFSVDLKQFEQNWKNYLPNFAN